MLTARRVLDVLDMIIQYINVKTLNMGMSLLGIICVP